MRLIPYLAFVALAIGALPYRASAEPGDAARGAIERVGARILLKEISRPALGA